MPWSPRWRMRRPKPCLSDSAARGSWYDPNGSPPSSRMRSMRAAVSGSSGTAKGIRSITTSDSASPGTSTPSQKLCVASSTEPIWDAQRREQQVARALALHEQRERKSSWPRR